MRRRHRIPLRRKASCTGATGSPSAPARGSGWPRKPVASLAARRRGFAGRRKWRGGAGAEARIRWTTKVADVGDVWAYVVPSGRGRGVGAALYAETERYALGLGARI